MSRADRDKWEAKYRRPDRVVRPPSAALLRLTDWIPTQGRALDIAGGDGRHSVWLAQRGLEVTCLDIAPSALALATDQAQAAGVPLHTRCSDLDSATLPAGPWDLILQHDFLYRPLFGLMHDALAPGGRVVIVHPTQTNIERHASPSARFLLGDEELQRIPGLETLHRREGWTPEGRHLLTLVAQRPNDASRLRTTTPTLET